MVPILLVMAAYAVMTIPRMIRQRQRAGLYTIVLIMGIAMVSNSNFDRLNIKQINALASFRLGQSYLNQAAAECEVGDYNEAVIVLKRARNKVNEQKVKTALAFLLATNPDNRLRETLIAVPSSERPGGQAPTW